MWLTCYIHNSIFQLIAVVLALACVASAQLVDDWNNDFEDQLETVTKTGPVGRNIIFRRTSTRFEKLEQTTETLAKDLLGTISDSTYVTNASNFMGLWFSETTQQLADTSQRLEESLQSLAETKTEVVGLKTNLKGKLLLYAGKYV